MIFLLNYERIRYEVTTLTKYRMAEVLKISPDEIEVTFQKTDDGELSTGWGVKSKPEGVSDEKVRETCIAIARWMKANYLTPRLLEAKQTAQEARNAYSQ